MTSELQATAYWATERHRGELRAEPLPEPGPGDAVVRTLYSGISRGTERLVREEAVPPAVAELMRAPFQIGDFGSAVKYGYLSVGEVERGPADWVGTRVFCLYPHQDRYVVPVSALTPIPAQVPSQRAVIAGTVETAVNALWDAAPCLGDRIAVVGAGMVGCCVAAVLSRFPLERLQLVDVDARKREVAERLGVDIVDPQDALDGCDLVFHASASSAGLARGLELLGDEGELIELSWYGTREPEVPLGLDFHARRLSIRASQVGAVAARRRTRRTTADRMRVALDLLRDARFDALLSGQTPFAQLPEALEGILDPGAPELCHVVSYGT